MTFPFGNYNSVARPANMFFAVNEYPHFTCLDVKYFVLIDVYMLERNISFGLNNPVNDESILIKGNTTKMLCCNIVVEAIV